MGSKSAARGHLLLSGSVRAYVSAVVHEQSLGDPHVDPRYRPAARCRAHCPQAQHDRARYDSPTSACGPGWGVLGSVSVRRQIHAPSNSIRRWRMRRWPNVACSRRSCCAAGGGSAPRIACPGHTPHLSPTFQFNAATQRTCALPPWSSIDHRHAKLPAAAQTSLATPPTCWTQQDCSVPMETNDPPVNGEPATESFENDKARRVRVKRGGV